MTPPNRFASGIAASFASGFTSDLSARAAVEASLSARLAQALTAANTALPHDLSERLRVSRERAMGLARQSRRVSASGVAHVNATGTAVLHGGPAPLGGLPAWVSTLLPVLLVLAGLWAIGQLTLRDQILDSADIDTQLLADELPPAAYGDPGFVQYLRHGPQE